MKHGNPAVNRCEKILIVHVQVHLSREPVNHREMDMVQSGCQKSKECDKTWRINNFETIICHWQIYGSWKSSNDLCYATTFFHTNFLSKKKKIQTALKTHILTSMISELAILLP